MIGIGQYNRVRNGKVEKVKRHNRSGNSAAFRQYAVDSYKDSGKDSEYENDSAGRALEWFEGFMSRGVNNDSWINKIPGVRNIYQEYHRRKKKTWDWMNEIPETDESAYYDPYRGPSYSSNYEGNGRQGGNDNTLGINENNTSANDNVNSEQGDLFDNEGTDRQ